MIRAATPADVAELAALDRAGFAPRSWSAEQIAESLSVPRRAAWIEPAVGYAMAATAGDVTELERIAVAPAARRHGAGRRLVRTVVDHAAQSGASRVLLEVAADNAPAIALYEAAGGTAIDRRRDYYGRGADALVLVIEVGR